MSIELIRTKEFAWLFLALLSLTSITAWVVANPPLQEQFASISILGKDMAATNYFPGSNSSILLQEVIQWNVEVYNHLGSAQLFLLRMKLANQTTSGPDATTNTPSSGKVLIQTYRAVLGNETWNIPIDWLVSSFTNTTTPQGSLISIESIEANGQVTNATTISAIGGKNFRMVLELESYDLQTSSFVFSFRSNGTVRSVWDQIWFSLQ